MTHRALLNHTSRLFARIGQRLAVLAGAALPGVAMAELPTLEQPSQGGDGLLGTAQGYLYDGAIIAGLVLCTAAFIWVGVGCLSAFNEARLRGQWASFGVTLIVGILLLLIVVWLATQAATILVA